MESLDRLMQAIGERENLLKLLLEEREDARSSKGSESGFEGNGYVQ